MSLKFSSLIKRHAKAPERQIYFQGRVTVHDFQLKYGFDRKNY